MRYNQPLRGKKPGVGTGRVERDRQPKPVWLKGVEGPCLTGRKEGREEDFRTAGLTGQKR